jgi:hypothetical protein
MDDQAMTDVGQQEAANGRSHSEDGEEMAATRPDKVIVKEEQVDSMMEDSASAKPNGDVNGRTDGHAKTNGRDVKSEDSSIKSDAKVKQEADDVKVEDSRSEAGDGESKAKVKNEKADKKTEDKDKKSEKSSSTKDKEKDKKKASRYSVSLQFIAQGGRKR